MPNKNGTIIEMYKNGMRTSKKKIDLQTVLIDGK